MLIEQLEVEMSELKMEIDKLKAHNESITNYPPPYWLEDGYRMPSDCDAPKLTRTYPPRFHGEVAYKKSLRSHEYEPR